MYCFLSCEPGHYCPENSTLPIPCPSGTFNEYQYQSTPDGCTLCTSGYYCAEKGLNETSGLCAAGCQCPEGSINECEIPCEIGSYCVDGEETLCQPGYACPIERMTSQANDTLWVDSSIYQGSARFQDYPCEPGYYCPEGSTDVNQTECPKGAYCLEKSAAPTHSP